jgi:hypothetical protein
LETVTEVIVKLLDGAFTLLAPVLKLLRMVFTVMSYTIFPLVKLAFSALGFVFKYTFKALMFVYENTIEPVINGIAYVFNLVLDTITSVVKKVVEYAIGWYNDTLGKVFGKKENPFDTAKAAVTAVATKTTEIAKEKAEDTKEWFGSLSESVTEGVSDAMSTGQQLGGSASESLNSLVEALKQHTEAVKDQTVALSNSPLGMKIKEKGAEALDYMLTPMSNQMQYVASPSASLLSQQEMMNSALGYKGKAGDTIVNNVVNNTSGSNGGGGMIPMISSGHMDPTKVALQISYRPPG